MMWRRRLLGLPVLAIVAAVSAHGTVAHSGPRPLSEWVRDVAFLGTGEIANLSVDPTSGYASFSLVNVETWLGQRPGIVVFSQWTLGYTGLSEGQRMVFYAFKTEVTHASAVRYVAPSTIFRMAGRDCFRFDYAGFAVLPENTFAVHYLGYARDHGFSPVLLLNEFRQAVLDGMTKPAA